ncbi:hypothetical protein OQA88_13491 [Cercophora sp. LCS_1]
MSKDGGSPPPVDLSIGYRTLAILLPLFALSLLLYGVRIWTRVRPEYRLNAADYTISVAMVAETVTIALTTAAVARGFGKPASYLSVDEREFIGATTFSVFIISLWSSCFARVSMACLLLQVTQSRGWRIVLWNIIAFQTGTLITCDILQIWKCRPIRAMWAPVSGSQCMSQQEIWAIGYTWTAVGMISDGLVVVLPMALVWKLTRSVVEKMLLSVLIGTGTLALAAGVFKILTMQSFDIESDNIVGDMMPAFLWVRIEEVCLIIAACAPLLKPPLESMLSRGLGLPRFRPKPRGLNSVHTVPQSRGVKYFSWNRGSQEKTSAKGSELSGSQSTASARKDCLVAQEGRRFDTGPEIATKSSVWFEGDGRSTVLPPGFNPQATEV